MGTNKAGEDLLQKCEANNKEVLRNNSFMKHQIRGTWLTYFWRRWYEFNSFISRQVQRHRKVKKMATIGPPTKNHMDYNQQKAGRHAGRGESVRKVNWENKRSQKIRRYLERVYQGIHIRKDKKKENIANWDRIANILTSVAEEVFAWNLEENNTKPWFNWRENEISQMQQEITNWM